MTGALNGLRVVDLSTLLAGPQVSAVLADFGADVVKVEGPDGDPLTRIGAQRNGRSLPYVLANRGKRRVIVDPSTPLGLATLAELTSIADVVVTNQPEPVLLRWACTPPEILDRSPSAVVVTVSCYGSTGPWADRVGNGSLAEAFAGLTHLTGERDGPPTLTSAAVGDSLVGIAGALAALAACWHRDAGGGSGQHVDVSMYEPIVALLGPAVAAWSPGDVPPTRTGSRVGGGAPRNVYRCSDGRFVVLSGTTDAQARRVLEVIGEWSHSARRRFERSRDRLDHADELDAMVAAWIAERSGSEVMSAFTDARVPIAPVNDLVDLAVHPQVVARRSLWPVDDPVSGSVTLPGPIARMSSTAPRPGIAPLDATSIDDVLDGWRSTRPT